MIPNIEFSFNELKNVLITSLKAKNVPMVWGATGQGKSSLARDIAETLNLKLVDIRLAERESIDIN